MRDTYGQLPPSELDMRRCAVRLLNREELTRADLAIIGWCQRENHPILRVTEGT
jgi:hypothetical protein